MSCRPLHLLRVVTRNPTLAYPAIYRPSQLQTFSRDHAVTPEHHAFRRSFFHPTSPIFSLRTTNLQPRRFSVKVSPLVLPSRFHSSTPPPANETTLQRWKRRAVEEYRHYRDGTKAFFRNTVAAWRISRRIIAGDRVSRKDRLFLRKALSDVFRIVPFSIFVIVPFMELALPFALKIFPNLLPSTYQDVSKKEATRERTLAARLQLARFLQDTTEQMAVHISRTSERDRAKKEQAERLAALVRDIKSGRRLSRPDLESVRELFDQELTLNSLPREMLMSMAAFLDVPTYVPLPAVRFLLKRHLATLRSDDLLIQVEGVDSLDDADLHAACRRRGIDVSRANVDRSMLEDELREWLYLSLQSNLPPSLVVMSRMFSITNIQQHSVSMKLESAEREVAALEAKSEQDLINEERQEAHAAVVAALKRRQTAGAAQGATSGTPAPDSEEDLRHALESGVAELRREQAELREKQASLYSFGSPKATSGDDSTPPSWRDRKVAKLSSRIEKIISRIENRVQSLESHLQPPAKRS